MDRQLELWDESVKSESYEPTISRETETKALHDCIHAVLHRTKCLVGLRDLQRELGYPTENNQPTSDHPVKRILTWMREAGEVTCRHSENGEPTFGLRVYPLGESGNATAFLRPDRQQAFDGLPHQKWPDPDFQHDRNTITVDQIAAGSDGPAHRFTVKRGDHVEVVVGTSEVMYGDVVGISHARGEVRIRCGPGEDCAWLPVDSVYPTVLAPSRNSQAKRLAEGIKELCAPSGPVEANVKAEINKRRKRSVELSPV